MHTRTRHWAWIFGSKSFLLYLLLRRHWRRAPGQASTCAFSNPSNSTMGANSKDYAYYQWPNVVLGNVKCEIFHDKICPKIAWASHLVCIDCNWRWKQVKKGCPSCYIWNLILISLEKWQFPLPFHCFLGKEPNSPRPLLTNFVKYIVQWSIKQNPFLRTLGESNQVYVISPGTL